MSELFWESGVILSRDGSPLIWPGMSIQDTQPPDELVALDERTDHLARRFRFVFQLDNYEFVGVINPDDEQFDGHMTLNIGLTRDAIQSVLDQMHPSPSVINFYKDLLQMHLGESNEYTDTSWGRLSVHEDGWTGEAYVWVVYKQLC